MNVRFLRTALRIAFAERILESERAALARFDPARHRVVDHFDVAWGISDGASPRAYVVRDGRAEPVARAMFGEMLVDVFGVFEPLDEGDVVHLFSSTLRNDVLVRDLLQHREGERT